MNSAPLNAANHQREALPPPPLAELLDKVRSLAHQIDSTHSELETLECSATSNSDIASATANSVGDIIDLTLAPDLARLGSPEVSAAILEATTLAVRAAHSHRVSAIDAIIMATLRSGHASASDE